MLVRVWSIFVGIVGGLAVLTMVVGIDALFFDDNGATARLALTTPTTPVVGDTTVPSVATQAPVTDASTTAASAAPTAPPTTPPGPDSELPTDSNPIITPPPGTVALLDVYTADELVLVTVQVDGASYEVEAGEAFASQYVVVSITGICAEFRRGDTPFQLCEGSSVTL